MVARLTAVPKVDEVLLHPLEIPLAHPFSTFQATQQTGRFILVEVRAEGLVGFGEADPRPHITGETVESAMAVLEREFIPAARSRSVADLVGLHASMAPVKLNFCAKAALDIAFHDLLGQALGLPVRDLLGGSARERVVLNAWSGLSQDPETTAEYLLAKVAAGYDRAVKVKVGNNQTAETQLLERLVSRLPPGVALIVDANQAWSYPEARQRLSRLAGLGVTIAEQPVGWRDVAGLRRLNQCLPLTIMADESAWTAADAFRLLADEAAGMLNLKLLKCGGLQPAREFVSVAQAAGAPCMVGSTVQTAVSAAAQAHLAAASPIVTLADIVTPSDFLVEDVASGFQVRGGAAVIGDKPGLGIEVDRRLLQKYRLE